ncbi:MAG TPA: hypothetical protein DEA40_16535 [Parvularcula sp.]|nr:hypothetical protein [Parvularcula sp.]
MDASEIWKKAAGPPFLKSRVDSGRRRGAQGAPKAMPKNSVSGLLSAAGELTPAGSRPRKRLPVRSVRFGAGGVFQVRLRVLSGLAIAVVLLCPSAGRAEPFSSYWATLGAPEQDFVDQLAAGLYSEERGRRLVDYDRLNSASKQRYRARAVEALGVENRPARVRKKAKEL